MFHSNFFNEDSLERIAGLVDHPEYLHPKTANKKNLEVAKVLTIIDPRQPLPEAGNVQYDSGEISRVLVSSLGCRLYVVSVRRLVTSLSDARQFQRSAVSVNPLLMLQQTALRSTDRSLGVRTLEGEDLRIRNSGLQ